MSRLTRCCSVLERPICSRPRSPPSRTLIHTGVRRWAIVECGGEAEAGSEGADAD